MPGIHGILLTSVATLLVLGSAPSWAGAPHFVSCTVVGQTDSCLSVAAEETGLGDEPQISVELTATALCLHPGDNHPQPLNKSHVVTDATIPVQNGKANYTLQGCAVFQPECSPPRAVIFANIETTDLTNNLTCP
jgi:hypothetical protein